MPGDSGPACRIAKMLIRNSSTTGTVPTTTPNMGNTSLESAPCVKQRLVRGASQPKVRGLSGMGSLFNAHRQHHPHRRLGRWGPFPSGTPSLHPRSLVPFDSPASTASSQDPYTETFPCGSSSGIRGGVAGASPAADPSTYPSRRCPPVGDVVPRLESQPITVELQRRAKSPRSAIKLYLPPLVRAPSPRPLEGTRCSRWQAPFLSVGASRVNGKRRRRATKGQGSS